MSQEQVATLVRDAVMTILSVSLPMLGLGLAVGLILSVIQATTQINEQTIVFVAKIVCVFLALILFGRWMLIQLTEFAYRALDMISGTGAS
ncbi:MAG: flagellar biosynthesis protein FliQ [Oscillospiraceae bacterium]|jgi:flagellar biosynthetic protein FliQ|nr:flagellar biosynthesis protein FliQ [Oscillospiraceae bacterium]